MHRSQVQSGRAIQAIKAYTSMFRDASHLPAEWSQPFMTDQLPLTVLAADIGGWIVSPFLLRQSS